MTTKYLRDNVGRPLGRIDTDSDGRQVGKTVTGHPIGYYDPATDKTSDKIRYPVGSGNQLASLVIRAKK